MPTAWERRNFSYSGLVARGWPYINSHLEWIAGGFLIAAFGGGMLLEWLHKKENFYLNNLLKLNRLYSKYQSSLLVLLMLLAVHFLALGYCVTGIAEMLPFGDYEKYYPYDAVWMAQEKEEDESFGEELAKKYNGTVTSIPMIRVSTYFEDEQIGISASVYEELTGTACDLRGREIICAVSEVKSPSGKNIASDMYKELDEWLVPGRMTEELYQRINAPNGKLPAMDTENLFQLKKTHTQNWFGEYGTASYCEDVIVFSDEYYNEQRKILLNDPEEVTALKMFAFPEKYRGKALEELKDYVDQFGVKDPGWTFQKQSTLYITKETVAELEKADIFKLTGKLFIMITLFMSGLFALIIKTLSEIPYYEKRYEFLECMGIREQMRKKTISTEIQSMPVIAVLTAAVLSAPYLWMHIMREDTNGIVLERKIWLYWAVIVAAYLLAEYVLQKIFVIYVERRVRR